ncbi:MAG: ATP-dependent Clp protease ATP-binding subunit [Acidobacteria bacterium]|nr:ATP-dependent Clp protease ATP-binding subunit [Acidobacteriota bacterium]
MNLLEKIRRQTPVATPSTETKPPSIYDLAKKIDGFEDVAHPSELKLADAVRALVASSYSNYDFTTFSLGENGAVASLAVLALAERRADNAVDFLLDHVNAFGASWTRYFALEALDQLVPAPQPLLGRVIVKLNDDWYDGYDRFRLQFIRELARRRVAAGETATFGGALANDKIDLYDIRHIIDKLDAPIADPLRAELDAHEASRTNVDYLRSIGAIWDDDAPAQGIVETEGLADGAELLVQTLTAERRRSVLVVGEDGVGKTTLIRTAAKRLRAEGWIIFEASANEVQAGQSYFGQLEQRIAKMLKTLRAPRRVAWIIPRFQELAQAGQHRYSDSSVLDALLPEIDAGHLAIIAEIGETAFHKLVEQKRRVATAFVTLRVSPADEEATLSLARQWATERQPSQPLLDDALLAEAWQLTTQFLGMRAAPGNLLGLLESTLTRLRASAGDEPIAITLDDLLVTLSQLTGLPNSVLDDREGLDLASLRAHFEARVMGQAEAVNVLVDRVAMIKAGVCDPTRPFGVFLFAGPTGTGKTEIAKTLAEYLFGSAERMIRIDMSEMKTGDSLARLVGDGDGTTVSLVDEIRKQPFSVVLLDEFEKADSRTWDLFLQVFDDGRLTSRRGVTADFRHALIIMTSNVGAAIKTGGRVGFSESAGAAFQSGQVMKALEREFRKEFLNRIDRVVVFQPLERETMRNILRRELDDVFRRRGLRNRNWSVEWEEAALDVLLAEGFTVDLGARPLKRAVERKLLAPLAERIVSRQAPSSEQTLRIRAAGDELEIHFS